MTDKYENPTSDDYMGVVMGIIMSGGNAKGFKVETLDYQAGDEAGIKSVTLEIGRAHV